MCDPDYSFEKFFDIYDYMLDYHKQIKPIYYSFKIYRNKIIQKFQKEKKRRFNTMVLKKFSNYVSVMMLKILY